MAEIMRTYSISDNLDDGSIPRSPFKLEHISIYLIFLFLCLFIQSMFPGLRFRSDIYRIWIRLSRKKKKRKNTDPTWIIKNQVRILIKQSLNDVLSQNVY